MSIYPILMLAVAAYVAKPAFTGKGKLMHLDFIKEGREKAVKKGLRASYIVLFCTALILAGVSFVESAGFTPYYDVTFTEDFTAASGVSYTAGQTVRMSAEEAQALADAPAVQEEPAEAAAQEAEAPAEEAASAPSEAPARQSPFSCMPAQQEAASSGVTVPAEAKVVYIANEKGAWVPGETDEKKMSLIRTVSLVVMLLSFADIIFMLVFSNKMTDKEARKEAQAKSQASRGAAGSGRSGSFMPKEAFNFDDFESGDNTEEQK